MQLKQKKQTIKDKRQQNIIELTSLAETLEKQVICKFYKPIIHKHSEHMYTLCCDNPNGCVHARQVYYNACIPYGENESDKVYIDICDRCFEALKGHKDYLTSMLKDDLETRAEKLENFLKTSNVDDWR